MNVATNKTKTSALAPAVSGIPAALPAHAIPSDWLRVKEACAFSRLSKPKLYDLMNRGLIKSVSLRERGMVRGTRLVSSDSLRGFLESRASGGEAQAL
ncbi:MAG: helix-turn-helix domain-containing protein [Roseimicrobium sp.]